MPDADALAAMYGAEYHQGDGDEDAAASRDVRPLLRLLEREQRGRFLDYGCGADGLLLVEAARRGWATIGVEYSPAVAAAAAAASGATVVTPDRLAELAYTVDVLNLGDVVEHLTAPLADLRAIVRVVRPGGFVVAQGPLEAQADVFTWAVAAARLAKGRPTSDMAPYHVLLATAEGQRQLFQRAGLTLEELRISETAWPAPARLRDVSGARSAALFGLRRLSAVVSRMTGRRLGNRYDYVGRVSSASHASKRSS